MAAGRAHEPAQVALQVFDALHDTTDIDETSDDDADPDSAAATAEHAGQDVVHSAADAESAERTGTVDTPAPDGRATDDAEESPVKAWLVLFGQAIVGLAVGVGLFWGFTELWRWNPYFALVLAVLVIFGIVTLSHVVRRTKDLPTTLLALGVGLLVTIGPLVLLAA